jgi:hypothetical protein
VRGDVRDECEILHVQMVTGIVGEALPYFVMSNERRSIEPSKRFLHYGRNDNMPQAERLPCNLHENSSIGNCALFS